MDKDNMNQVLELHLSLQKLIAELVKIIDIQHKELQRIEKEMHFMWKELHSEEFKAIGEPDKTKITHQN